MRLFFAVTIPDSRIFQDLYSELKTLSGEIKPVRPDLIHITLKFLGEISISPDDLAASVKKILSDLDPFNMRIDGSGAFPNWSRPSVLWFSLSEKERLVELASDLSRTLEEDHGIPPESRPFRSHITVARIRRNGRINSNQAERLLKGYVAKFESENYLIPVKNFRLISSDLTPQGPIYTEQDSFDFI